MCIKANILHFKHGFQHNHRVTEKRGTILKLRALKTNKQNLKLGAEQLESLSSCGPKVINVMKIK